MTNLRPDFGLEFPRLRNRSATTSDLIDDHLSVVAALRDAAGLIDEIAGRIVRCVATGRKVVWCGNGGSAADGEHLAAELVGRFSAERAGVPSIALTANGAIVTALANDYDYDDVFARQVSALCVPGDILVGLSTSGRSSSVIRAVQAARARDVFSIAFTGGDGGMLAPAADLSMVVPSDVTARIQEAHMLIGHIVCLRVDEHLTRAAATA